MRRSVGQPIGRHDAIQTGTAHPVVAVPVLGVQIDILDPGARGKDIVDGSFCAMAAVVRHVHAIVSREGDLDLAVVQVAAGELARVAFVGGGSGPDQAADHQHVLGRIVTAGRVVGDPKRLACIGVEGSHGVAAALVAEDLLAASEKYDVIVDDQRRGEPRANVRGAEDGIGLPLPLAGCAVQANDVLAVMPEHTIVVGRQCHWHHRRVGSPLNIAGVGLDGNDLPRRRVPGPLRRLGANVCDALPARDGRPWPGIGFRVDDDVQHAVRMDQFVGGCAGLVCAERLASGRIQGRNRFVEPEGDVDTITNGDQPPRNQCRATLQHPKLCMPGLELALPEDRAVERVAGDQREVRGQLDLLSGTFVEDVEHSSARGY